ncbi:MULTISPECIES: hypothetical protein [Microbacterium]|uniref:hypothetical protein n=1 Tax=Microbacterium TaxID=33882 RepID=UPI00217E8541|nr:MULTISPECIES: hypothetical protein [Microbacterium]UWF76919.1 hypothetical protein JSY13_08780 [Microbacterium neungamense]WCM55076.1 hypothetical protein JRG78_08780 [Microbacterium sp. EF45047]
MRPIVGADRIVRLLAGGVAKHALSLSAEETTINGTPALLLYADGELDGALALRIGPDGVSGLYYVRNPEKLSRVLSETVLAR